MDTDELKKLLACPFCGGEAEILPGMGGLVGCMNCALPRRDEASWNTRADGTLAQRVIELEAENARLTAAGTFAQGIEAAANRSLIEKLLRHHRLQFTADEEGLHYPLLDALTPDGCDVGYGEDEIHLIADMICGEICALSTQPEAEAVECLGADEQKAQAMRCPCRGTDEYCTCQNSPDQFTREARAEKAEAELARLRGNGDDMAHGVRQHLAGMKDQADTMDGSGVEDA